MYAENVRSAEIHASLGENLENARLHDEEYLIAPTILHWVESETKQTGKPDRIVVKLELIEVASEAKLDTTILMAKGERTPRVSYWQLLIEDGHPQDLLADPLNRYVDTIFEP
jgi:hypothetical protein